MLFAEAHQFHRSSIDQLIDELHSARLSEVHSADLINLGVAMQIFPPGSKPWGSVFRALVGRNLRAYGTSSGRDLLKTILVSEHDFRDWATAIDYAPQNSGSHLTARDAAIELGTGKPTVWRLIKAGFLRFDDEVYFGRSRILRSEVLAFAKEFAFTPEIADRMGVRAPELKQHLAELGVYPHASVTNGAGHIWRRVALEGIAASNI